MPAQTLVPPLMEPLLGFGPEAAIRMRPVLTPSWAMLFVDICREILRRTKTLTGTHAVRLTTSAETEGDGTLFIETDRGLLYRASGTTWVYVSGVIEASLATAPTDLGATDAGLRLHLTTFHHAFRWTGTAWTWAEGDGGNDYYEEFHSAPSADGWVLSTVAVDTTKVMLGATLTAAAVRTRASVPRYNADNAVYYRR